MHKPKKICCRITPGRILGGAVMAASVVNLIIVGTAFQVSFPDVTFTPTITPTPATMIVLTPAVEESVPSKVPLVFTDTPVNTSTVTPTTTSTATPTDTPTATPTDTQPPSPIPCSPRTYWPVYIVQGGDNLSRLALATGSNVPELMLANCLNGTIIYVGQRLYVPRLPILAATATPTATASTITPSHTPTSATYTVPGIKPGRAATATSTVTILTIMPSLAPSYTPMIPIVIN